MRPDPTDALAAPGDVHPQHDRAADARAQPDAAAVVQSREVDVSLLRDRLARIHEQRHLETAEHIPAVLERRHERVVVVEPVLVEAAQLVVAAELAAASRTGPRDRRRHRRTWPCANSAMTRCLVEVREELLALEFQLAMGVGAAGHVHVAAEIDAVEAAAAWGHAACRACRTPRTRPTERTWYRRRAPGRSSHRTSSRSTARPCRPSARCAPALPRNACRH